jgi:hypothetical protein
MLIVPRYVKPREDPRKGIMCMPEPIRIARELDNQSLFIDGYFSKRILAGERPDYGYPTNHLPEIKPGTSMEVKTGFIAAVASGKK